tara:strand:- start:170 stop:625 length:456 start_codon:yes stop_codon:yes gene_type:complete
MNKLFLTLTFLASSLLASAQFSVFTTIDTPEENAEWEMSNITDNIGVSYYIKDNIMVGIVKNGEEYDVMGRYDLYNVPGNTVASVLYAQFQGPTEEMMENAKLGLGYSYSLESIYGPLSALYIEPSYHMPIKEDVDGNREGEFKIGLMYRF